ncbi:MAG: chemotaxis protein CheW [Gammaproteobacteria bacterium]|jgi:twitching motility protein PilI|nr:chemotaxis protein CheW [Gammaproteobacteria bacterium]
MTVHKHVNPVAILKEIEEYCRGCEVGLPRNSEEYNEWSGIAFRLGHNKLIAPLDDVVEILDYPQLSVVPLTQPWVRGIANVRGNLLPVIDLNGFLGKESPRMTQKTRILVINFNDMYSGLVVDEVLGLKHFLEIELTEEVGSVDDELLPYMRNGFRRGDKVWGVFSLLSLFESPLFLKVAV